MKAMSDKASDSLELIITGDGSHTVRVPGLKEHYHSVFGALAESLHVFIGAGLERVMPGKAQADILEVGFGTGLNAILTLARAAENNCSVFYTAIEKHPLSPGIVRQLNYPEMKGLTGYRAQFDRLHEAPWDTRVEISESFCFEKRLLDLHDFHPVPDSYDLVYFDAFGPDVQPEMWTTIIFERLYRSMRSGGALVTYSTKGEVKRNLKSVGFMIGKLPGPPGKREMLRAFRP